MKERTSLALLGFVALAIVAGPASGATSWIYATVAVGDDNHLIQIDVTTGGTTDIGICTIPASPATCPA